MRLRRPCEHDRYEEHFVYETDEPCPGGEFLPEDAAIVVDRGDAIEQIGLITTDPRWSHVESPLLLDFALTVLDALAADQVGEPG